MNRAIIKRVIVLLVILVIAQIPLLHNWVLFDVAFPFPYIGFIILLPLFVQRGWSMVIAFVLGLVMDVFSNTPGIHTSGAVLIAYLRLTWVGIVAELSDEDLDLTTNYLGFVRFSMLVFPLVLIHHFLIFTLENEGFRWAGLLFSKIIWSSIFSYFLIWLAATFVSPPKRRI